MSTISEPGTTWYLSSDEQEPFLELPLRECTPDQIRAKVEFLEKNILLLKCECEVMELNSIKAQPELAAINTIDVSWMPYDTKAEEYRLSLVPPKVSKLSREKLRQSAILSKSNKSVLGSIYSVVNNAIKMNKISIHQVIAEVEKALITMDEYFDKINNTMIKSLDKIEYETENINLEINRQLQNIETFRANVLVAGVNRLTKRIPADKYIKFIKKKLMSSTIYLNDLQFKITDAITEEQMLHETYVTSKHIRDTVFETDMHNVRMMNKKLLKEQIEISTKNNELKQHLSVVRQDYLKKKYDSEKFELSLDLPLLDAEIKRYRNKLLRVTPKLPAVVEIHDNYKNDIDNDDDNNDDDSNDYYGLNEIATIPSKTLDGRINHYLEVKRSIEKTERDIKSVKLKLNRQKKLIQMYAFKLKNQKNFIN
ncbi:PREDICTED: protein PFC0760c-like [Diuraphis noxia]|uniref:protein PFC0760c-like n=1 Tax=Diuraphis noxia TaxID=143948 RepID=UPI000763A69E|nr:PREDICTED: protein PFC0760c-like [Diuraphis noxia]